MLSAGKIVQTKDVLFDGEVLECVPLYKYLGLIFSSNGNVKKMEEDRIIKARKTKTSFVIRQAISSSHISTRLSLSLLYGCPIWGIPSSNCTIRIKNMGINTKL